MRELCRAASCLLMTPKVGELAIEVWGPYRMSGPTVHMSDLSMPVIGLGMHVEQWDHQHPQSSPHRNDETKALGGSTLRLEHGLNLSPFCGHDNHAWLQFNMPQAERIRNDGHGAEGHGGTGDHRAQEDPDEWIENAGGNGDP